MLKAFDIETCAGLIANRGLLSALFLPKTTNFLMAAGLGIGRTQHGEPVEEGAIGRKGISNERTFQAISATAELVAKASFSIMLSVAGHSQSCTIIGAIRTQHSELLKPQRATGPKCISNERTIQAMSAPAELEAKASSSNMGFMHTEAPETPSYPASSAMHESGSLSEMATVAIIASAFLAD